jgi:hypothetical protein
LGERDALPDDLRDGKIESASVIEVLAVVVAKHLFVKVAKQMEWFDANIGSAKAALEQRPEVLDSVRVETRPST